ncbi:MAG: DUF423 domain-containing protein [Geminicoccaceae bacterium]
MQGRHGVALAAALGLVAVGFGAFAAHGLEAAGDSRAALWVETGSRYQLAHAVAIIAVIAWRGASSLVVPLWASGTVLFSGSLYALALGAPPGMAMFAPVGGAALLLGWAALIWQALRDQGRGQAPR